MNTALVLFVTVGVGFFTGLRAFAPLAIVSWLAIWGWIPLVGSPLWFMGTNTFALIVSVVALGELVGDKLPKTPPRIRAAPLTARMINGAFSAAAVCVAAGERWVFGVVFGGLGALAGAFAGYHLRRTIVQRFRIPDLLVALIEDLFTIAGVLFLVRCFFGTTI